MLRRDRPDRPLSPAARGLTAAALAATALAVAGLRGPDPARAQPPTAPPAPVPATKPSLEDRIAAQRAALDALLEEQRGATAVASRAATGASRFADPTDLSRAPESTVLAVAGRPSPLLNRPESRPLVDMLRRELKGTVASGLDVTGVEAFAVLVVSLPVRTQQVREAVGRDVGGIIFDGKQLVAVDPPAPPPPADGRPRMPQPYSFGTSRTANPVAILRMNVEQNWGLVFAGTAPKPADPGDGPGAYYPNRSGNNLFYAPDDRTLVVGTAEAVRAVAQAAQAGPTPHAWDAARASAGAGGDLVVAGDPKVFAEPFQMMASPLAAFRPLVDQATGYAMKADLTKGLGVDLVATTANEPDATRVGATLGAGAVLGSNMLREFCESPAGPQGPSPTGVNSPAQEIARFLPAFRAAADLLSLAGPVRETGDAPTTVRYRARTGADAVGVLAGLVPVVVSQRTATRRARSVNNMKLIGLAMHNYYSTNGHLPAAAVTAPGSKFPHSWRVAVLPFVEESGLYQEYNLNEPWDSPTNLKVLAKMPAVFRHPEENPDSTSASYFVVTGPETLFPGDQGSTFDQVTDGTSNTLMIVEARRPVPWTQPADVPFVNDPKTPPPAPGGYTPGGFNAGFADGSVRFIRSTIKPVVLRALLTRAGGEVVSADAY